MCYDRYEEVINKYEKATDMPTRPKETTYSPNHIFDEEQSVKWNREEVIRRNEQIKNDRASLQTARFKAIRDAEDEIVNYLADSYPLISKNKVRKLFDNIHSKFYRDYFNCTIEYVIDMCQEYLEIFAEED
jgi:hypothetical protein